MLVKLPLSHSNIYVNLDNVISLQANGDMTRVITVDPDYEINVELPAHEVAQAFGLTAQPEPGFVEVNLPIWELDLPVRMTNALDRQGIKTLKDLMDWTWPEVFDIRNVGLGMMKALDEALNIRGLQLKDTPFRH